MDKGQPWQVVRRDHRGQGGRSCGVHAAPPDSRVRLAGRVAVRREYRLRGIGGALLHAVLEAARREGLSHAVVYTYSLIVGLAPGATLYLKARARSRQNIYTSREIG